MEANTLADRELLLERRSELVAVLVKINKYRKRNKSNACRIERNLQAHTETEYAVEDHCYPSPQGIEASPRSRKYCSLEEE